MIVAYYILRLKIIWTQDICVLTLQFCQKIRKNRKNFLEWVSFMKIFLKQQEKLHTFLNKRERCLQDRK